MMLVKIKTYKLQAQGVRGRVLTLPKAWVEQQELSPGDSIDCYGDESGRLILEAVRNGNGEKPRKT